MRKDMKKSSYYVWFLGAQEAKGLRGPEYILPALNTLIAREREVEPFKVTLQVSHKGLKIIQNVPKASGGKSGAGGGAVKWETVKHLVPAEAVTCALQQADVVAAILLLVNPATRCPVHVHAYRCDSVETASLLRAQLAALAERPDTLRRIAELEARLRAQGLLPPAHAHLGAPAAHAHQGPPAGRSPPLGRPPRARRPLSAGGSDGRSSSTRESDSSGSSGPGQGQDRIASLYDSLAAELRAKLGCGGGGGGGGGGAARAPLLLPPRDYDTVHRARGNVAALDLRRAAPAAAPAGPAAPGKDGGAAGASAGAGGSSGPSSGIGSDHAPSPDRQSDPRFLDNGDSSDEDWNDQPSEDSLLVAGGWDLSLPRARRHGAATTTSASTPTSGHGHGLGHGVEQPHPHPQHCPPPAAASSPPRRARQRSPSPGPLSPRDRFKDAKEKFLLLEREERVSRRPDAAPAPASPPPPAAPPSSASLPERGGGGGGRARLWSRASDDDLDERYYSPQQYQHQQPRYDHLDDGFDHPDGAFSYHQPPAQARRAPAYRHHPQEEAAAAAARRFRSQSPAEERGRPRRRGDAGERALSPRPAPRQHGPAPEDGYRPRAPHHLHHHQPHHQHQPATDQPYDGRHPAADIPLHRYRSPGRSHAPAPLSAAPAPSPAPAPAPAPRHRDASPLDDAYSSPRGGYDKRRSMFDVLEEERRRNSNELAREFKRRSYQDAPGMSQYQELADHERFPGLDRETARLNHHGGGGSASRRGGGGPPPMAGPPGGGYRHSYAEGALPLHRTNSSVSSGRVGLAAVHPY